MQTISAIILSIIPLANIYKLFGVSAGDVLILLLTLIFIFFGSTRRNEFVISSTGRLLLTFFAYAVLTSLFMAIYTQVSITSDFFNKWAKIVVYVVFLIVLGQRNVNITLFSRVYILFAMCIACVLILQALVVNRMILFPYIGTLELNYNLSLAQLREFQLRYYYAGIYRPASVFAEPAHFAQYELLGLCLTSYVENIKKRLVYRIIITASLVLCGSGNGIGIALVLWGLWYYKAIIKGITKQMLFLVGVGTPIGIFIVIRFNILEQVIRKLATADRVSIGTTGNLRLLQGVAVFEKLPVICKIFGLGFGNVQSYLVKESLTTRYLSEIGNEYMNAFSTVLVSAGVIGLILFLIIWYQLRRNYSKSDSAHSWIVLSILFLTSGMFYSVMTIVYLSAIIIPQCKREYSLNFISNGLQRRKKDILSSS